jgi:serine/threonine protein phosphatase 1
MKSRWVIPDIHGCCNTLKALIDEQIKPTRYDELYFLGDYIDRGPDSKGVIDYIRLLQKEEYTITALRGNHEEFMVDLYDSEMKSRNSWFFRYSVQKRKAWKAIGGKETLKSFGVSKVTEIPLEYIDWMRTLGYYVKLDDFILVHAGLNFDNEDPFEDTKTMLWTREYKIDPVKIGNRRIIHGHVPLNTELIHLHLNSNSYKFIDLDNGPYINGKSGFGNLVALELNTMKMVIQDNRDY